MVSLEEAQRQVSFSIPQPTDLPAGVVLKGAHVLPQNNWVQTFYGLPNQPGGLAIETIQGPPDSNYIFPDTARQPVRVNDQSAECIQGAWDEQDEWRSEADVVTLEWSAGRFFYHMQASDLDLDCAALIEIAASLE